jgi:hypothetical protein
MKNSMGFSCLLLSVAFALLGIHCSNLAGNTSETGNAAVAGTIYLSDGKTPASGAKVYLIPADHIPAPGLDQVGSASPESTTTNDNGVYTLDTVSAGQYNILAKGSVDCAYRDSIVVSVDIQTQVSATTLKPRGSLHGIVRLMPGEDASKVFILFKGTTTWGYPDDASGSFTVDNLAEGKYKVRIYTWLDNYKPKDTVLSVTSGKTDTLDHDLVLQYTGIPVLGKVAAGYDTLNQVVTLHWGKPTMGKPVLGYYVYRRADTANAVLENISGQLISDTVFVDARVRQDLTYEYRVSSLDSNYTEGVKSSGVKVSIVSSIAIDSLYGDTGSTNGQFNEPSDITVAPNGDVYIADKGNNRIQVFGNDMRFKRAFGAGGFSAPVKIDVSENGMVYVAASKNGQDGNWVFIYDSLGAFSRISKSDSIGIKDIAVGNDRLMVLKTLDTVSVFSAFDSSLRTWQCKVGSVSLLYVNPNRLYVNNTDSIASYDSLGTALGSWKIPSCYPNTKSRPLLIAYAPSKRWLYTFCAADPDNPYNTTYTYWLVITDDNNQLIAKRELPFSLVPNDPAPSAIAVQPDGHVLVLLPGKNKMLRLQVNR